VNRKNTNVGAILFVFTTQRGMSRTTRHVTQSQLPSNIFNLFSFFHPPMDLSTCIKALF